ncbi:MAG: ESPR domain-containing protein, partial [Zoogloeaceae bacterium]|nr:ESPR domain-containing protein [Zoogloeaceae bacterium]
MNHCYKVIFNRSLGVWQAVTELAKSHGKSGGERAKAASSGAARRRAAVSGLLLSAAGIGLFGATDALARCYNKTSLDNGRGNQSPLIRTAAQVSGGANIGTYQPVSNDVIICDQDTTPVPAQPNTLLNPLNATTQI